MGGDYDMDTAADTGGVDISAGASDSGAGLGDIDMALEAEALPEETGGAAVEPAEASPEAVETLAEEEALSLALEEAAPEELKAPPDEAEDSLDSDHLDQEAGLEAPAGAREAEGDHFSGDTQNSPEEINTGPGETSVENDTTDQYVPLDERIKQTPINNGYWTGERGDSTWQPDNTNIKDILNQYGVDGIDYRDGFPDFAPITEYEANLPQDLLQESDYRQFDGCNQQLQEAIDHNPELANRFTSAQIEDIRDGDKPDGFSWHHDVAEGRMQLVPTRVHQSMGHVGGRSVWGGGNINRKEVIT